MIDPSLSIGFCNTIPLRDGCRIFKMEPLQCLNVLLSHKSNKQPTFIFLQVFVNRDHWRGIVVSSLNLNIRFKQNEQTYMMEFFCIHNSRSKRVEFQTLVLKERSHPSC